MNGIQDRAKRRGITRLCHFTPSRNLLHIASDPKSIFSSRHLQDAEAAIFNPTDKERLDGYVDHVCCSIQYPNAWYFQKAQKNERLFPDWVVLLIDPHYLWQPGTRFCPRNAAAAGGRLVNEGTQAFDALFTPIVEGVQRYQRGPSRPDSIPTDEQAEVLVPDGIGFDDVHGIVVRDDAQAARVAARLKLLVLPVPCLVVVPEFFDPGALSKSLRSGRLPVERQYNRGGAHA